MALLNDLDETEPIFSRDPREGDDHVRQVKDKVKAWAHVEHDKGTGWHKIYTNAATPTPSIVGHLWLRSTDSELFAYISGGSYTRLTSKAEVTQAQADIADLEAADVALQAAIDAAEVNITNLDVRMDNVEASIPAALVSTTHDHVGGDGNPLPQGSIVACEVGDYIVAVNDESRSVGEATPTLKKEIYIGRAGNYRVWFSLTTDSESSPISGQIYKNSTPVGTLRTHSAGASVTVAYSEDISGFVAGDKVRIYCSTTDTGADVGSVSNFRLGNSGATILFTGNLNGY